MEIYVTFTLFSCGASWRQTTVVCNSVEASWDHVVHSNFGLIIPAIFACCDQISWSWMTKSCRMHLKPWAWASWNSHYCSRVFTFSTFSAAQPTWLRSCSSYIAPVLKPGNPVKALSPISPLILASESIFTAVDEWLCGFFPERTIVTPGCVCSLLVCVRGHLPLVLRLHYKLGNLLRWLFDFTSNSEKWALEGGCWDF